MRKSGMENTMTPTDFETGDHQPDGEVIEHPEPASIWRGYEHQRVTDRERWPVADGELNV